MIELREYQEAAVVSIFDYFTARDGNPLVVLPTGAGKSLVLGEFLRRACVLYPETRALVLSHVKELLVQDAAAILRLWPDAPLSLYSAGLNKKDLSGQIVVAGIQSIHRIAYDVQQCDLVLIDEAHLVTSKDTGMYRRFLRDLSVINPHLKIVGLTATAFRTDSGLLHRGKDRLFTDICHEVELSYLIDEGYLSPLRCKRTDTTMSVEGVHVRGGDYVQSELAAAVDIDELNRAIVGELVEKAAGRGSWLLFCVNVEHANHIASLVREAGVSCETVFGDTPAAERARILGEFKRGEIRCIANVGVLTTGFDAPGVDLIGFLRPTKSKGLYVQMSGRGTRLAEGKSDCLVLDFAGVVAEHGPVDMVKGGVKGDKSDEDEPKKAPTKECEQCHELCAAGCRECPACGHPFPPPKLRLAKTAIQSAILARELKDEWLDVTGVTYRAHHKFGSPTSLRVEYRCGMVHYPEWVCLEHFGFPRQKAVSWWNKRAPGSPVPDTVDEALDLVDELPVPKAIIVRPEGKYFDIAQVRF